MSINEETGEIDLQNSDAGTYEITYRLNDCDQYSTSQIIEIINVTLNTESIFLQDKNARYVTNNPVRDVLIIEMESNSKCSEVIMHDLQGKLVQTYSISSSSDQKLEIDIMDIPSGIYLLSFRTPTGQIIDSKKIIKI